MNSIVQQQYRMVTFHYQVLLSPRSYAFAILLMFVACIGTSKPLFTVEDRMTDHGPSIKRKVCLPERTFMGYNIVLWITMSPDVLLVWIGLSAVSCQWYQFAWLTIRAGRTRSHICRISPQGVHVVCERWLFSWSWSDLDLNRLGGHMSGTSCCLAWSWQYTCSDRMALCQFRPLWFRAGDLQGYFLEN